MTAGFLVRRIQDCQDMAFCAMDDSGGPGSWAVMRLRGELGDESCAKPRWRLGPLIDTAGRPRVAIELSGLAATLDGGAFADTWRGRYLSSMQRVNSGERDWACLGTLHRESLQTQPHPRP